MAHDGHSFDLATAVAGGPERWTAEVDPGWTVAGRPNGGYLLALAGRAALEAAGQPHPLAVSAHFLSPAEPGPAELETRRRAGWNRVATARVATATAQLGVLAPIPPDSTPRTRTSPA